MLNPPYHHRQNRVCHYLGEKMPFARKLVEAIAVPSAATVKHQHSPVPQKLKKALTTLRVQWNVDIDMTPLMMKTQLSTCAATSQRLNLKG